MSGFDTWVAYVQLEETLFAISFKSFWHPFYF